MKTRLLTAAFGAALLSACSANAAFAETPQETVSSILNGLKSGDSKSLNAQGVDITFKSFGSAPSVVDMLLNGPTGSATTRYAYDALEGCKFRLTFSIAKPGNDVFREVFKAELDFSNATGVVVSPTKISGLHRASIEGLKYQCAPVSGEGCPPSSAFNSFFTVGEQADVNQLLADFTSRSCQP